MQSDPKEIYRLTSERTEKDENTYKEIGNFVFSSLYSHLRRPKSLRIRLLGVGIWYVRKARLQVMTTLFPPDFDKKPEDFTSELKLFEHENKIELYNIFMERLKDYEKYSKAKADIKEIRNAKASIQPSNGQE